MVLLPSPAVSVIVVLKAPLVHVGTAPTDTPLPAMVTGAPWREQVPLTVKELAEGTELPETGAETTTVGAVLFTVRMPLGPTAALVRRAVLVKTAAGRLMDTVPSPVQLERVTVRFAVPVPLTALLQVAVPVVFKVISVFAIDTEAIPTASEKVSTQAAEAALLTALGLTLPIAKIGSELFRATVLAQIILVFPARSVWLAFITLLPSPALKVTVAE